MHSIRDIIAENNSNRLAMLAGIIAGLSKKSKRTEEEIVEECGPPKPPPRPLQGRNTLCNCGSMKKYKNCCRNQHTT